MVQGLVAGLDCGILVRIYLEARYIASWSFVLAHVDVVQCLASIVDVVTGYGCGSVPSREVKKVRGSLVARCVGRVVVELLKVLLRQTDHMEEVMRDYRRHHVFDFWKLVFRRPSVFSMMWKVWWK